MRNKQPLQPDPDACAQPAQSSTHAVPGDRNRAMDRPIEFSAVIRAAGGGGAYIELPFDAEREFGKKRVKVAATIDGVPYRGSIVRMGGAEHLLPVLKAIRARTGKSIGDEVAVTIEEDTSPRVVCLPEDFGSALDRDASVARSFAKLSYTHQREFVEWIEGAKREETRHKRILRSVVMLKEGRKTPR